MDERHGRCNENNLLVPDWYIFFESYFFRVSCIFILVFASDMIPPFKCASFLMYMYTFETYCYSQYFIYHSTLFPHCSISNDFFYLALPSPLICFECNIIHWIPFSYGSRCCLLFFSCLENSRWLFLFGTYSSFF